MTIYLDRDYSSKASYFYFNKCWKKKEILNFKGGVRVAVHSISIGGKELEDGDYSSFRVKFVVIKER